MRILHVASVAFGLETLLLPQIDFLRSKGLTVHAVCSPDPRVSRLRDRGYTVHEVPIDRKIAPVANARSVARLRQLMRRENYDLVHTHAPVASVLGRVAAKLAGVPRIVYTAHGFYFHENMPRAKYLMYQNIEAIVGKLTDRILVQSEEDYNTAIAAGIGSKDKVRKLGNGIDLSRFEVGRKEETCRRLRTELGVPDDGAPVLGITGRITEEKGFRELVEALAMLRPTFPKIHLVVIGGQLQSERDAFQQDLVALIGQETLGPHVTFAGFRNDVPQVLELLDLFVLPSYREGLPRSVLEAMAKGLAVVTTDIRGCREAVVDGETGLIVPPRDSQRLAEAISRVSSDATLARRFGQAGRERVVQQFDERLVFRRIDECYRELGLTF